MGSFMSMPLRNIIVLCIFSGLWIVKIMEPKVKHKKTYSEWLKSTKAKEYKVRKSLNNWKGWVPFHAKS